MLPLFSILLQISILVVQMLLSIKDKKVITATDNHYLCKIFFICLICMESLKECFSVLHFS